MHIPDGLKKIPACIIGVAGVAVMITSIVGAPPVYAAQPTTPKPAVLTHAASKAETARLMPAVSRSRIKMAWPKQPMPVKVVAKAVAKTVTVKPADTLWGIGKKLGHPSAVPMAVANKDRVKNPNLIFPGQTLRIPTHRQVVLFSEAIQPVTRISAAPKKARIAHQAKPIRNPRKHLSPNHKIRVAHKAPAHKASRVQRHSVGSNGSPQTIARQLLAGRGWSGQWGCFNSLVNRESGWDVHADNPGSDAFGIPQALPGRKMASMGSDWHDSARTQLRWMMGYIGGRYGSPCGAWAHSQATNWY